MKLRNKKTGEIIIPTDYTFATYDDGIKYGHHTYYSLAELNDEWEDVEELKDHYYIDYDGDISIVEALDYEPNIKVMKQIGNYFETREEAELAVKKLKAWKRLKDAGFKFGNYSHNQTGTYSIFLKREIPYSFYDDLEKDLDLLFGGE